MFPVEIWEEILRHVDPVDLARLRRVCKCWNEMIPTIYEQTDTWYKKCQKDMPEKLWSSILEQQDHPEIDWQNFHRAKNYPHVWISLYRSWMNWRKLLQMSYTIETLIPVADHRPMERITCVAALNDIIAVGSSEGYMTFYNLLEKHRVFPRIDHGPVIEDVQLWRNGDHHIIASSLTDDKRVNHWNVNNNALEHRLRAKLMSASFQYCYTVIDYILSIEQPQFDQRNGQADQSVSLTRHRYELPNDHKIVAIGADRKEVTLWSNGNVHFQFYSNENGEDSRPIGGSYEDFEVDQPEIPIRFYQIFKPRVVSCIGELGEFGFSVNGREWKIYDLFQKFHAPVTVILFHVAILVVGLESGQVHLFTVNDPDSLADLNFETMESKILTLDSEPIVSLNAMEHNSIHYLVAATFRNLYVVKFL